MARTVEQIEQDLASLDRLTAALAQEFYDTYQQYLSLMAQAVRQQLIVACYHLCTHGYPDRFLRLSLNQRTELQQSLRQLAQQTDERLMASLQPVSKQLPRQKARRSLPEAIRKRNAKSARASRDASKSDISKSDISKSDPSKSDPSKSDPSNSDTFDRDSQFDPDNQTELDLTELQTELQLEMRAVADFLTGASSDESEDVDEDDFDSSESSPFDASDTDSDSDSDNSDLSDLNGVANLSASEIAFLTAFSVAPLTDTEENEATSLAESASEFDSEFRLESDSESSDTSPDPDHRSNSQPDSESPEERPAESSLNQSLTPTDLLYWQEYLEEAMMDLLQNCSHAANRLMQKADVLPSRLPEPVLEVAAKADLSAEAGSSPPNLLSLLVETETEGKESAMMPLLAVRMRLTEIEFGNPSASVWRSKIRNLQAQLKKLGQDYQKRQKEHAIAQAEAVWRSSWFED